MKKIILLLLLTTLVWGSKILSYNIYDRHDRVDVMLTFDTPYEGVLRQNQQGDLITIKLEEASIDTPLNKNISSSYLQNITITSIGDQIQITAKVSNNVVLQASKTSDSYGLRLRFSAPAVVPLTAEDTTGTVSSLPTKDGSEFEQSYYVVIGILVIGIAILFWLKQNIATRATAIHAAPKTPWLFNTTNKNAVPLTTPTSSIADGGVHIRFQKTLDPVHSVAMLGFRNTKLFGFIRQQYYIT